MMRYYDVDNNFVEQFDPETGFYLRTGVLEDIDKLNPMVDPITKLLLHDSNKDPFMRNFPQLIDVGIMGHCIHGASGLCMKSGVQCYQNGLKTNEPNMSLENFKRIVDEIKGKTFQCLDEEEVVLIKDHLGNISSKYIKDVNIGDFIFYKDKQFVKVIEKNEKVDEVYRINLPYGKSILATKEHKFPTKDGLKTVAELKIDDELVCVKGEMDIAHIQELDIVKMIIDNALDERYFLSDCPGMKDLCKKLGIKRNNNKTVKISYIKDYLNEIDYSNSKISKERSPYKLKAIYPITPELMLLLGHFVGNGSKRSYVISTIQIKMIKAIEMALHKVFPDFKYSKKYINNTYKIELNNSFLNHDLFVTLFHCRTITGEKQLPNFIFGIKNDLKLSFLKGYFCDGNMRVTTNDGHYGEIVFNTSSKKLAKDIELLLISMGVDYSSNFEKGKNVIFSKKESRTIHRKDRYRICVNNLIELKKVHEIVSDHKDPETFSIMIKDNHNSEDLRNRKGYVIKKIEKIGTRNVVDTNVYSDEHLFMTSHGIISHNCALGGRGDVDQHENFEEIVKYCRKNGIVPNFTSSGLGFNKHIVDVCKKYCGAVAISQYSRLQSTCFRRLSSTKSHNYRYIGNKDSEQFQSLLNDGWEYTQDFDEPNYEYLTLTYESTKYTYNAVKMLLDAGVKTNIHFVLGNNTLDEAINRLKDNAFPAGINAVIFLLHKPVGLGLSENVLHAEDPRFHEFWKLIDCKKFPFKIGFDSCTVPGILNFTRNINLSSIDSCEGGRYSCYITSDMKMLPCSFDNQELRWAYDISNDTIQNAWNSPQFELFREHFRNSCPTCTMRNECLGECPIRREIVLCNRNGKDLK